VFCRDVGSGCAVFGQVRGAGACGALRVGLGSVKASVGSVARGSGDSA